MVQLLAERPRHRLHQREVDQPADLRQLALDLDADVVVVAVQRLAAILERGEVGGGEAERVPFDGDFVRHGGDSLQCAGSRRRSAVTTFSVA